MTPFRTLSILILAALLAGCGRAAPDAVTFVACGKAEVGASDARLGIAGKYHSPYDAADVRVDAIVTAPDGTATTVPCFWYVPMKAEYAQADSPERGRVMEWERFQPTGKGDWRFRLRPTRPGAYSYAWRVALQGGKAKTRKGGRFTVQPAAGPPPAGPITCVPGERGFRHADGTPFVPVAQNLGWPEETGARGYAQWLDKLHRHGANAARLWLVHYFGGAGVEWSPLAANAGYGGVGVYSQEAAARVDRILDACDRDDIYLMLCFFSFGDHNWDWQTNPYARAAGGWLDDPAEFFTDARARRAVRNRLRYAVARYGWSPRVWAWELWNEVDLANGYDGLPVNNWHEEMAAYLKQIDAQHHLVTTSYRYLPFWYGGGPTSAYDLAAIDFVQVHVYSPYFTEMLPARVAEARRYHKPVLVSEFGLGAEPDYFAADPAGLHLHDGLWAGVFSGAAGTAMAWWWERYVDPRDLYFHYQGIARYLEGEDLSAAEPTPADVEPDGGAFALALRTPTRAFAWVAAPRRVGMTMDSMFFGIVQSYRARNAPGAVRLTVRGEFPGRWTAVVYDTFDGVAVARVPAEATADGLVVTLPPFRQDAALKLLPAADVPAIAAPPPTPLHDRFTRLRDAAPPPANGGDKVIE